jgi:hypothetical protein
MHRTADYKRDKALKSCFMEFYHIRNAALFSKGFLRETLTFFVRGVMSGRQVCTPVVAPSCSEETTFGLSQSEIGLSQTTFALRQSEIALRQRPNLHNCRASTCRASTCGLVLCASSTPVDKPSTPVDKPSTPVDKPSTPVDKPSTPVDEPSTPVDEPSTSVDEPSTPEDEPSTPQGKRIIIGGSPNADSRTYG